MQVHDLLHEEGWETREGLAKTLGAELDEVDEAIVHWKRLEEVATIELTRDTLVLMQSTPRQAIVELSDRRELDEIEAEFDRRGDQ